MTITDYDKTLFPFETKIDKIIEGGMGRIFYVTEKSGHKMIAKTLRKEFANDIELNKKFLQEAQLLLTLSKHPFIVNCDRLITSYPQPIIMFHEVDGWDLLEWRNRNVKFDLPPEIGSELWDDWWQKWRHSDVSPYNPATLLYFIITAAYGLEMLYQNGIKAHGDLHSRNIMIQRRPTPYGRLIDLGLAKTVDLLEHETIRLTEREGKEHVMGCRPFIAPEILTQESALDQKSDFYSLGIIMYYCIVGEFPYESKVCYDEIFDSRKENIIHNTPIKTHKLNVISESYKNLIFKCIDFDRNKRPENISDLIKEMQDVLLKDYRVKITFSNNYDNYDSEQILINKASGLANFKEHQNEAIHILIGVTSRNPNNSIAHQVLAQIFYDNKRINEAYQTIKRSIKLNPEDFYALNTYGIILNAMKRYNEAIKVLQLAIKKSDSSSHKETAIMNLCISYKLSSDFENYNKLIKNTVFKIEISALIAIAKDDFKSKEYLSVINMCNPIIEQYPLEIDAYILLGKSHFYLKSYNEAYITFKSGLKVNPNNDVCLNWLAYSGSAANRPKGEIISILDRIEIMGELNSWYYALRAAYSEGEDAKKYALKTLELDPSNIVATSVLNETYRKEKKRILSEYTIPKDHIDDLGIPSDMTEKYIKTVKNFIVSVHNTDILCNKITIMNMFAGLDMNLVLKTCELFKRVFKDNTNENIQSLNKITNNLYSFLQNNNYDNT